MSKAIFEISGTSDSLKPLISGTQSSSDMRNALGSLHQGDFAPLRARAEGYNTLGVWVNPAVIEGYYQSVLNISGVSCTYPSGISPTTWTPASNNRIDVLHINADEPSPSLFWVSGTSSASPTIPKISASGTPICAVYHRSASIKTLQTDDGSNSYLYRDMRPLYSYGSAVTNATQANMEAAISTSVYVTPSGIQYSPCSAKAFISCSGTPSTVNIATSLNVSSATYIGAGNYRVDFAVPFSSPNYAAVATTRSQIANASIIEQSANYLTVKCLRSSDESSADVAVNVVVYGDF